MRRCNCGVQRKSSAPARLPVLDGTIRDLDLRRRARVAARAVAGADFFDYPLELGDAFEAPQAVFEVFRNSELRSRPGGELAEHPARMKLAVLLDHELEVAREEGD